MKNIFFFFNFIKSKKTKTREILRSKKTFYLNKETRTRFQFLITYGNPTHTKFTKTHFKQKKTRIFSHA